LNTGLSNITFTLCSNNYLAQAKTLGDSFLKYHHDMKFIIGLVDAYNDQIDYSQFSAFTIIPVATIEIPDLQDLSDKFDIVELNTAVKPFYFSYFFKELNAGKVIYLDPDTRVFSPLEEVLNLMDAYNIILTPQLCEPTDDGHSPTDQTLLITGTFNLGFIALSGYTNLKDFLKWWTDRVVKYGFAKPGQHMFYDQLIINLVPAYFDNYYILRNKGYNMAGWNMYERTITTQNEQEVLINGDIPLRFFHYSGYQFNKPDVICKYNDRYDFISRPDVKKIFNDYQQLVMGNNYQALNKVEPAYNKKELPPVEVVKISTSKKIAQRLKRTARVFLGYE